MSPRNTSNHQRRRRLSFPAIWLVTQREYRKTLGNKGALFIVVLVIILCAAFSVLSHFLFGEGGWAESDSAESEVERVVVAGIDSSVAQGFPGLELMTVEDEPTARAMVEDGEADGALFPDTQPQSYIYFTGEDAPDQLGATLESMLGAQQQTEFLRNANVSPEEYAAAGAVQLTTESAEEMTEGEFLRLGAAAGMLLAFIMLIIVFAGAVAQNVIEEKASRVVEVILATVRPLELLSGKILGGALAGLTYAAAIILVGWAALSTAELPGEFSLQPGFLLTLLPCFLVGFLFFATVYTAAASLVSRMEDFSAAQAPVLVLIILCSYVPFFGLTMLDSTFMQVVTWIPPLSITVAPIQFAAGSLSGWAFAGTVVVSALGALAMLWLAARIYPRTVMRVGKRVTWREALRKS